MPFIECDMKKTLIAAALVALISSGCEMKSNIVRDMDAAYAKGQNEPSVSEVILSNFPIGSDLTEVHAKLHELKATGFVISEYTNEGARPWPAGSLKPYFDESTKRNMQNMHPLGVTSYVAEVAYDKIYVFHKKVASIRLVIVDGKLSSASGIISVSTL
jgi:hypothetical protein